ncbi:hypothetical protein RRF57_007205 [Xylaria bambusicola]|uniref:Uncharacterized protein n=1 Tax=Xylaria bambusicola TaxID=326684 RepID=A0AAN7ZA94_9PEZI
MSRIQRVQDLGNDIAVYQDEIKSQNDKQKQSDERDYETLGEIAKMKGYKSPEEYVDAALAALPTERRQEFQKLREEITKTGRNGETILFVTGIVATLGMIGAAILTDNGLKVMSTIGSWASGLRASATSVELSLAGAANEAKSFAGLGEEAMKGSKNFSLRNVTAAEGTLAAKGAQEASTLLKVGRFASKATVVLLPTYPNQASLLQVLATIGGLIYEGVEGKKQMEKCQQWTLELCAKRFMVYKMKDNTETMFSFMSKIYGLLEYEKLIREDEDIPPKKKETKIQKKIQEVADEFGKLPVPVDATVYGSLGIKDEAARSWTNGDPTLGQVQQYIQDLGDGKVKTEG